ncbi:hypothetical protein [Rhodococcoides yunnanense]|uniref:hypothetical protein n=1 Tax=Rhodococcoides yunnanense TaxID=278209 RepID=UPI000934FA67|nr:hypothetical protein [Rhodococcus yunnanensis]
MTAFCAVGLAVSMAAVWSPSTASAQPEESAEQDAVVETTVMSGPALGLASEIVFDAADVEQTVRIPVPSGSSIVALTGQLRAPIELGRGYLEVTSSDGRFLGSADIPDVEAGQRVTPFSIDVTGARVDGGAATLRMSVRPFDRARAVCSPAQRLVAADLAASFTAASSTTADQVFPATVQQFFPSLLTGVDVFVDPAPTNAERQGVLNLAAALVRRYDPIPVQVFVRPLDRSAPIPPAGSGSTRSVVVRDRGEPGAGVVDSGGGSVLVLSGTDSSLVDQVGLFSTGLDQLIQTSAGRVSELGSDVVLGTDTLTFEQLGAAASTSVLGSDQLFSGFDASSFGLAQPGSAEIHLMADYTPVADGDNATVTISAGGSVVHSQELDSSGRVDTTFPITGGAMARTVGLNLALTYSPQAGCTPFTAPMQFAISPNSTVTVSGRSGGVGGFRSLPTSMMPTFQVAFDEQDPEAGGLLGLAYATRAVASMQAMASAPLRPMLAPMDQVAGAGMGALLVADAESLAAAGISAPLSDDDGAVNVAESREVTLNVDGGIGSLQVFADGDRTLVAVTTTGAWSLVGPVLDRADGGGLGWSELSGDVIAAGVGGVAVPLTVLSNGPAGSISSPDRGWSGWIWIGAASVLVAAAVVAVGFWSNRRRTRGASR